jgi:hypothetical protein
VSTPTDGPEGQPNPSGQPSPYGQPSGPPADPYGAPPTQTGGGYGSYGSSYPGGPTGEQPQGKGMAIAALVLAFIPCGLTNLVSLVLAIVVLVKKKGGKGLAIAAIIIDVIVAGVLVALVAGGAWLFGNIVTVDNAEVGQCVSTDTGDSDEVGLLKQDCGEPHDAEVIVAGDLSAEEITLYSTDPGQICVDRYTDAGEDPNSLPGDYVNILTEDLTPEAGDPFVCIVENEDGSKLDAK